MPRPSTPSLPFPEEPPPGAGDDGTAHHEGIPHALQDDRPRTPGADPAAARAAPPPAAAAGGAGPLRRRAEETAHRLDGPSPLDPAGERPVPGFERSPGAGAGEPAGHFAAR